MPDDQLGHALVHDEVDRPARLIVARPRVEGDAAALLREPHPHVERAVRHAVAVHGVLRSRRCRRACGTRASSGSCRGTAARREPTPRAPWARRSARTAPRCGARRADSRPARARMSPCRMSGKREFRRKMRNASSLSTPSPIDADGGHDDALVKDLGGVGRDAARAHAADVPEVAPRLGEAHQAPLVEHGRGEDHVGRVRHAAARAVAVVVPVQIAGPHGRPPDTARR